MDPECYLSIFPHRFSTTHLEVLFSQDFEIIEDSYSRLPGNGSRSTLENFLLSLQSLLLKNLKSNFLCYPKDWRNNFSIVRLMNFVCLKSHYFNSVALTDYLHCSAFAVLSFLWLFTQDIDQAKQNPYLSSPKSLVHFLRVGNRLSKRLWARQYDRCSLLFEFVLFQKFGFFPQC